VQRGHDPRDYTLMAFGGAGPLHAARLAKELDIGRVMVPANPGILCAMGLLLTDLRADFSLTRLLPAIEASTSDLASGFAALGERARRWFDQEGIAPAERRIARTADMRYHGQNYELSVSLPEGPVSADTMRGLAAGFAEAHRQRYGFVAEGDPVQIVTLRLEAIGFVRNLVGEAPLVRSGKEDVASSAHRAVIISRTGQRRQPGTPCRQSAGEAPRPQADPDHR